MAKRKFKRSGSVSRRKATPKTRSRRRRIGATTALNFSANSPLVKWGSVALGFLKPDLIPLQKIVGDKLDPKIVAGAQVGLGVMLLMKKGKKSLPVTLLAGYLAGSGAKKAMAAFGIGGIGPYGRVPVIGANAPYGNTPVIAGRLGAYTPNKAVGAYTPNPAMRVMSGVNPGSGSGIISDPGSNMMN